MRDKRTHSYLKCSQVSKEMTKYFVNTFSSSVLHSNVLFTFDTESHLDSSPARLLLGHKAEIHRRTRRHFRGGKVPVLPANTPKLSVESSRGHGNKRYAAKSVALTC